MKMFFHIFVYSLYTMSSWWSQAEEIRSCITEKFLFASFFSSHYITSIFVILIRSPCSSHLNIFHTMCKKLRDTIPIPKDRISIIQSKNSFPLSQSTLLQEKNTERGEKKGECSTWVLSQLTFCLIDVLHGHLNCQWNMHYLTIGKRSSINILWKIHNYKYTKQLLQFFILI